MEYGKFDKIQFGKHKGDTITMIMANNPSYLDWCVKNVSGFSLDPEMEFALAETLVENDE